MKWMQIALAGFLFMSLCRLNTDAGGNDMVPNRLCEGRFGSAIELKDARRVVIPIADTMSRYPVTYEFWTRLDSAVSFNILLSAAPKSGPHWEIFTTPGDGILSIYIPQLLTPDVRSQSPIADGKWHFIVLRFAKDAVEVYVDGKPQISAKHGSPLVFDRSPVMLGWIANDALRCNGAIDDLRITRGMHDLNGYLPDSPAAKDKDTIAIFSFDEVSARDEFVNKSGTTIVNAQIVDEYVKPRGNRFLDEVQDELYFSSTIHGDAKVEEESHLPAQTVKAIMGVDAAKSVKPAAVSLSGEWLMKGSKPSIKAHDSVAYNAVKAGWFKLGYDRSDWDKVRVPTSVQNAMLKLGKIEDPFWNANTYDELDQHGEPKDRYWANRFTRIEQQEWWFAKKFDIPAGWKGRPIRLYFDGIDYSGSVYVNGRPLGHYAGMFGGPTLDITKMVFYDKPNEVVVRVDNVPENWYGILKGSPGWGWHYGHLISVGIWRDVILESVSAIEVTSPYVRTISVKDNKAVLNIEYYIDSKNTVPTDVAITGTIDGANFKSKPVTFENRLTVPYGRSRYRTQITFNDPHLWWPMNYGKPNLYKLELTASAGKGKSMVAVNSRSTRFGIRTIEMLPAMGTNAETDYRWQFVINGLPMFIKGANWCWSDPMLQCDPAKYERILELARRGGIQMFRAWGGGIVETDAFYDMCDEKGLMVYQEFSYCWGPPDFPGTDPQVLDQQVSRVVKRNRNHPSLIMWGGGNENVGTECGDEALFLVGRRCRQFDPSRPYHRTDPWGGSAHNWGVFHAGAPIDTGYTDHSSVFYGEYGLPSMTNRSSSLKYLPEEILAKWPPTNEDHGVLAHMNQFGLRDPIKCMRYADYGPIKSWDNYTEYSQMAQGDWLRYAAEGQRAGSNANKTGFWFYKFTDLFPGNSWAVVDFYGNPKISYYRAKQTCLPQAAFATYKKINWADNEPFEAKIWAANDTSVVLGKAKVIAAVYGSDLKQAWTRTYAVSSLKANQRDLLDTISVQIDPARTKPFMLAVAMYDSKGALISDQWYWLNYQAKSDAVKEIEKLDAWGFPDKRTADAYKAYAELTEARLLTLPRTKLSASVNRTGNKGHFVITNIGGLPAFNVLVDNFPDGYKDFLDNNSFFLRPGESRKIAFELGNGSSLDKVGIRAWNADSVHLE